MTISKPYLRNFRPFPNGYRKLNNLKTGYIKDKCYAQNPSHYTRAYLLIQNDLMKIFEFVEPSDTNLNTYSYRIHELFMRTCIEIEANFKAILKENIFEPKNNKGKLIEENYWTIYHYKVLNKTHKLSDYTIRFPLWSGTKSKFTPFAEWNNSNSLTWYQMYNKTKHDRQNEFQEANLNNLLIAISALNVLLSSQFYNEDFLPTGTIAMRSTFNVFDDDLGIGGYLLIDYPTTWLEEEHYDFDWKELYEKEDRFNRINYTDIYEKEKSSTQ